MKQVFGAVYYRLFHAKSFWLCCLSAAGAGVLSLFVLAVLRDYIAQLPREVLQPLYTGGYYDLGVVKLADLGALQSPSAGMILGSAFRGSTLTMLVVAFTTFFAGACLRGVYFRGCVAAGISRARAYVGVVAAVGGCVLLFEALFVVSILAGAGAVLRAPIDVWGQLPQILWLLARQGLVLVSFSCFCVLACALLRKSSRTLLLLIGMVLVLPVLLNLLDLLLGGGADVSRFWVINLANRWAVLEGAPHLGFGTVLNLTLLGLSLAGGLLLVRTTDIE